MDSSSIIWSGKVSALQHQKDLPKVVQVEDGHYDENEDLTLSNGDVLTLHLRKNLRTYTAVSRRRQEIRIPTRLAAEVKTVNRQPIKTYNTIKDLVDDGVEKVEWLHDTPWLNIKQGDIMFIQELVDNKSTLSARMSFMHKNQADVYVPLTYRSDFKPVIWNTFWLGPGKEEELNYPITVQFIDETLKIKDNDSTSESTQLSTIADLGEVTLKGFQETEVFIASIKDEENRIIVMKIPTNLDITVRGGVGITDDDYTYVNVCQEYNRRAHLEQLDEKPLDSIRIGNIDAALERIYDVALSDDEDHEYIEPAPRIPTRVGREPLHSPTPPSTDYDEEDDDYEDCPNYEEYNDDNENNNIPHDSPDNLETGCCCFRTYTNQSYVIPQNKLQDTTPVHEACTTQPMRYIEHPECPDETLEDNKKDFQIPRNLEHLSTDEVLECLKQLNMACHIDTFKHNQINGKLLVGLNQQMLKTLGVESPFERHKLIQFINGWRPESH
ncbi:uncharacterized protein LOC110233963 [Exaiptasia diaphana]|uniref:SAM domain-containing protein n=1 Tax=Exaiptasia diaphana TaxID=2652724 RepID=A0A913WVZ1_EXADI|nr:uncharacterized protein LOC110233963 [Exaiptasia diaphana]KXJ17458.1 hypothetical protein AC249_AIPGENE2477 [Exaiptasia diaphana]